MDRKEVLALVIENFLAGCNFIVINDQEIEDELLEHCIALFGEDLQERTGNGDPIPRIEGYVERLIPQFSAQEFKSHFRLLPETLEFVLSEINHKLVRHYDGNQTISPRKQLLIALWRMATPDSYRSITQRFGVGKATSVRAFRRVIKALAELASKFIKWPTGDRIQEIANGFMQASRFPDVVGALDGTHIRIRAPKEQPEAYINRKSQYSIQLQAVCDDKGIFIHCYAGNVGSVHDARVFRLSSLHEFIRNDEKFPNNTHLLADAAYSLHQRVLVPYIDNGHLTQRQKNFNYIHSSARMAIERAFGLLKGRWRSLLDVLAMNRTDLVPKHIMACCVLHNICLLRNDELLAIAVGDAEVNQQPRNLFGEHAGRQVGVAKRDVIAAGLPMRI